MSNQGTDRSNWTDVSSDATAHLVPGSKLPVDGIAESGSYVCEWSGHLIRVTNPNGAPKGTAQFNFVAKEPLYVTKVSDNPFVALSKARIMAADMNLPVGF